MKITLLGQGYESVSDNSVGKKLIAFLLDKDFTSFTGMSAFSRLAGINGLSKHINEAKKHLKSITIITGVDQKGTTKEALEAILALKINSFIFYAPPPFPIFHTKIYLFEGKKRSELIIGSSNLTSTGLFSNIETSLLISIDNTIKDDKKIIEQLKKYFKGIFDFTDSNLKKISKKLIANFVKEKIVPTEAESKKASKKDLNIEETAAEKIISKIFPKREFSKIPREFRATRKTTKTTTAMDAVAGNVLSKGELAWQKVSIPRSIAQQVPEGTAIRGVIGLGDAGFKVNGKKIDRNTYFRNSLFGNLQWTSKQRKNNSPLEEAICEFHIKILGKDLGKHNLRISHDPERESNQNNILTDIHWGKTLNAYLRKNSIIGKSLFLYKPVKGSSTFSIVVE